MAKTAKEKLAELQKKEAQIKAQIQLLKARDSNSERKNDARRKILIGGAVLARVKRGDWTRKQLIGLLDTELKLDRDRVLFDLPLKEIKSEEKTTSETDGGNQPNA